MSTPKNGTLISKGFWGIGHLVGCWALEFGALQFRVQDLGFGFRGLGFRV